MSSDLASNNRKYIEVLGILGTDILQDLTLFFN